MVIQWIFISEWKKNGDVYFSYEKNTDNILENPDDYSALHWLIHLSVHQY